MSRTKLSQVLEMCEELTLYMNQYCLRNENVMCNLNMSTVVPGLVLKELFEYRNARKV